MAKLKVENGKIINKQRNRVGNFKCSSLHLTTLENCPEEVGKNFYCSFNNLTTLEGSPKEVGGWFYCQCNQLTTLENCPNRVGGEFVCSSNNRLQDISDLPTMVSYININCCYYIKVFTKEITNEEGTLTFKYPGPKVRERIKSWPYYEIVYETEYSITVKIKSDNELFMDSL